MPENRKNFLASIAKAAGAIKTLDSSSVSEKSRLAADLGFGSIDVIDLFFEIEKETDIEIGVPELYAHLRANPSQARRDFTVGEIIDFLSAQQSRG